MKQITLITGLFLSLSFNLFSQSSITEWRYYFSRNGVDFYSRWKTDYGTTFYQIKLVNNTSVKKYVGFDYVEYYQGASYISKVNGAGITVKPYTEVFGERDGLWWTTPKGYSNLSAKLTGVGVEDR